MAFRPWGHQIPFSLPKTSLHAARSGRACELFVKRAAGIEPASSAWKAEVLPLNYARGQIRQQSEAADEQLLPL